MFWVLQDVKQARYIELYKRCQSYPHREVVSQSVMGFWMCCDGVHLFGTHSHPVAVRLAGVHTFFFCFLVVAGEVLLPWCCGCRWLRRRIRQG